MREILNQSRITATEPELDKAVTMIQKYLEQAATKVVPARCIVSRSKPWWTKELTAAYRELRNSREVLKSWMREFHQPSLFLAEQTALKHKDTLKLVRKTKQEYYRKMTTEANAQNIWQLRNWTKKRRTFASPPISTGENTPPAITHEEKCQVLHHHLFPETPTLPEEPLINLNPTDEDIKYTPVRERSEMPYSWWPNSMHQESQDSLAKHGDGAGMSYMKRSSTFSDSPQTLGTTQRPGEHR